MKKCPYCAENIQNEAIVCKHCGRYLVTCASAPASNKKGKPTQASLNRMSVLLVVLVVLGAIAWMSGVFDTTDSTGRFIMPQSIIAPAPIVTKAKFYQIRDGMTYEQVVGIIGASGEVLSSNDIVCIKTVMYSWAN